MSVNITVNSLLDQIDPTGSSTVTLRDAINDANANGGATIQFQSSPSLASEAVPGYGPGVIPLSIVGDTSFGPSALAIDPGIRVTIIGPTGSAGSPSSALPRLPRCVCSTWSRPAVRAAA